MDENINLTANEVEDSPVVDTLSSPVLFKILKGDRKNFKAIEDAGSYNEGTMYYCTDTGELFIAQKNNDEIQAKEIGRVGKDFAINADGTFTDSNNFSKKHGEIFNDYINNRALGDYSHAEGYGTIASSPSQHVQGKYNSPGSSYAHIVGNGTSNSDRKNIHTLDWNGNAWFAGNVSVGVGSEKTQLQTIITNSEGIVPFEHGGTNANSQEDARESLNVYSKGEIDGMKFITTDDIDVICNDIIEVADDGVKF